MNPLPTEFQNVHHHLSEICWLQTKKNDIVALHRFQLGVTFPIGLFFQNFRPLVKGLNSSITHVDAVD